MLAGDLNRSGALGRFRLGLERFRKFRQALRLHRRGGIAPAQEVAPLAADRLNVDVLSCLGLEEPRWPLS